MTLFGEYRIQSIFVDLHALLILWLCIQTKIKFTLLAQPPRNEHFYTFIIEWGFLFLAIPISWAIITIRLEHNPTRNWGKLHSLISGLLCLVLTFLLFSFLSPGTRKAPIQQLITSSTSI